MKIQTTLLAFAAVAFASGASAHGYGALGRGVPGASLLPAPVVGSHRYTALAVGGVFNCGLDTDGAARCWGFVAAIGDGGNQHRACGLERDGTAWCWGAAILVGGGTEQNSAVPVAVAGGQKFRVLQAGGVASCGITTTGAPVCSGGNSMGAVGQANVDP